MSSEVFNAVKALEDIEEQLTELELYIGLTEQSMELAQDDVGYRAFMQERKATFVAQMNELVAKRDFAQQYLSLKSAEKGQWVS